MNALLLQKRTNLKPNIIYHNFYKRNLRINCLACSTTNVNHYSAKSQPESPKGFLPLTSYHNYHYSGPNYGIRHFHASAALCETTSKVDATVKKLMNQQKEKVDNLVEQAANGPSSTETAAAAAAAASATTSNTAASAAGDDKDKKASTTSQVSVTDTDNKALVKTKQKKALTTRIWEEVVHYYHGFRLLFIDMAISSKLLWRVLNGNTLSRRENKQLQRTTSDLFRLIPFSVFIIVPFMELLLPVFIKFFPGMLPSTFQTAKDQQNRLRQSLTVRLEVAKFLQKTLDQMPVQHKEHSSEEAKQFEEFFRKIRHPNEHVTTQDIIRFAKRFDDEITLDSLSREQLAALCRVLELNTIGTTTLLRFQLRLKLRSLAADDRVISREGVESLDLFELQQACKARGMRAYGLTAERLRFQLKEWIDLSLNEQVPPTLLLLSRAMLISDDGITTEKLKETMRGLPDAVTAHTRHAIGEREGKVDNKTKIEIIKEEERKIKEEREEEQEETIANRTALKDEQPAPYVFAEDLTKSSERVLEDSLACLTSPPVENKPVCDKSISSSDVQLLSDALKTLSSDKQMVVEKETIKELKEELADYIEDVEELTEVRQVVKEPVSESRAAKMLYNRVNKMIAQLDNVLTDLEQRQAQIKQVESSDYQVKSRADIVHIDELVDTIRRMKEVSDEERFKVVEDLMVKLDADKDGAISVNEITKVVQSIDSEASKIDKKQLEEFTSLLSKLAAKRRNEEIVHIDDLMQNIKKLKETSNEARIKHIESVLSKFDSDKDGAVTVTEIRKVLECIGRDSIKLNDKAIEELITLLDKEQILHAEQKIEKAIAKSLKEAVKLKADVAKTDPDMSKLVAGIHESAKEISDIAHELGAVDKPEQTLKDSAKELQDKAKNFKTEPAHKDKAKTLTDTAKELNVEKPPTKNNTSGSSKASNQSTPPKAAAGTDQPIGSSNGNTPATEAVLREAAERHVEKLLPKSEISVPPTIPPTTPATKPKPPGGAKATATASGATPDKSVVKKVL